MSETDDEINVESGAFCQNFQETLSFESDLFYNIDEFKMPGLPGIIFKPTFQIQKFRRWKVFGTYSTKTVSHLK